MNKAIFYIMLASMFGSTFVLIGAIIKNDFLIFGMSIYLLGASLLGAILSATILDNEK